MISKLSIMAFPQNQVGNSLYLNVFIVVRNFNPLLDDALNALSPAWVASNLRLRAMVIDSLEVYPGLDLPAVPYDLPDVKMAPEAAAIFTSLQSRFTITKPDRANSANVKPVKKYLPVTYRQSFNFTAPRNKDVCVTGDEYRCAVTKKLKPDKNFAPPGGFTDDTSWGKVFAFCLRHKELAKKCGFIHEQLKIDLADNTYKNGGWLYVDLHPDCSYYAVTQGDQTYTKRYAARIPKLDFAKQRKLFAAVEFPVLIDNNPTPVPNPGFPVAPSSSILDEMFIEAAEYDDGFCKLVHNYQPVSNSLLKEEQDDEHPVTNDIGIRLGWDDEQLAIWHARQMGADPATGLRPDAPIGVYQYRIDARKKADDPMNPNDWVSLCNVRYDKDVQLDDVLIGKNNEQLEMGVEVYPSQLDADPAGSFWLPSYFTQWIGNSLVLQDEDAIAIYHKNEIDKNHFTKGDFDQANEKVYKATKNNYYKAVDLDKIKLLYGEEYEFRVRMADTTGGGPLLGDKSIYASASPVTLCHFVRHVIPQTFNFVTPLPTKDTDIFVRDVLSVKRPLLGYPSVLFTGAYADGVQKLIDDSNVVINDNLKRDIGLPDPGVDRMEVLVEVKSLAMDTTISKRDPKDNFALLYTTIRAFDGENFDAQLDVSFTFVDSPILHFTGSNQISDLGLNTSGKTNLDERTDLVLPTARDIRITVRPVTKIIPGYYGGTNPDGSNRTELKGMPSSFITRRAATSEINIFKPTGEQMMIRGIYLQPDETLAVTTDINNLLVANLADENRIPTMMQRLSNAIGADNKGMSLLGRQGERWQFGGSRSIRHSAAPDNTSITFGTKDDLLNHWLVPLTLLMDRDWTWDGLQVVSMTIFRRVIFLRDAMSLMGFTDRDAFLNAFDTKAIMTNEAITAATPEQQVGDLEIRPTINIQALLQPDRSQTYCCFIDAVEPKQVDVKKFPDEIFVAYRIAANYLKDGAITPAHDDDVELFLHMPVTIIPKQMPVIVSAGMAFSKYVRDKNYANTETRKKYFWVEFDKPPLGPDDTYYARMLAYAPDTLLAHWEPALLITPQEPSLLIEPEPVRIISTASSDDKTGLNAMQEMVPASDSKVHYLVPLPPGLHADGLEMFGFFTYEFRLGHKIPWCTAQGRFGRPLRNTGIQHPVPQLYCLAERNELYVSVTAPFAQTVFDGRNVTAKPPRTEIWALLYAQVTMADSSDERNVLLADRKLVIPAAYNVYNNGYVTNSDTNSDATPQGIAAWRNQEVQDLLALYGLPLDSALSVLCVEMMPGYDNFFANPQFYANSSLYMRSNVLGMNGANKSAAKFGNFIQATTAAIDQTRQQMYQAKNLDSFNYDNPGVYENAGPRPLTSDLGNYRILRTSLLVAVPEVCCTV
jgi:hypothetical protein